MALQSGISRRELLRGELRGRTASASIAGTGLEEAPEATRDLTAPEIPAWDEEFGRVLEQMNDLSGITDS